MSMCFSQIPHPGKCSSTSQLLLPPGEPWIFGSLLAEPGGELETDKGCRTISQHPLPRQMVVGRWLRRRGRRGGSPGVGCGSRDVRGRVHLSTSPPSLGWGALPSPARCAIWEVFQVQSRESGPLTPYQDLPWQNGK